MSELSAAQKKYYTEQAESHANFLCEKVFKSAFIMAFIHGVKHGREDLEKEQGRMQPLKNNVVIKNILTKEKEKQNEH